MTCDDSQRELFEAARARAVEAWGNGVVTTIQPLETFWVGEEYHQDFFAKNPNQGYCNMVVLPKMLKTRKAFTEYVR
jgi:peptide-methionine (S)-S-oxide reductase